MSKTVEIRSLLDAVKIEGRDLKAQEVAAVLNAAGDRRGEALAVVNATHGEHGKRVDSLRTLFAENDETRSEFPGETDPTDPANMLVAQALAQGNPAQRSAEFLAAYAGRGETRSNEGEQRHLVPSISEYRALVATTTPGEGGYTVPSGVANSTIERLTAASALLRIPGLNIVRYAGGDFTLPQITSWSDATVTAEKGTIAEGTQTFGGPKFHSVKYTDLRSVTNEHVADSAVDVQRLLSVEMTKGIAAKVDKDAFSANTTPTAGLIGLETAGNSMVTTLTAGNTKVKWDDVISGYARVLAGNAVPTAVLCSVDMFEGLLKERATANGDYLAGQVTSDPANAALGLPLIPSNALPVRTVTIVAGDRVFLGIRQDVSIAMSGDALFAQDSLSVRATMRVAGLLVAEASSVQIIRAAAA